MAACKIIQYLQTLNKVHVHIFLHAQHNQYHNMTRYNIDGDRGLTFAPEYFAFQNRTLARQKRLVYILNVSIKYQIQSLNFNMPILVIICRTRQLQHAGYSDTWDAGGTPITGKGKVNKYLIVYQK